VYGLEHIANAGIKEVGIILGPIKTGIQETIGDGSKFGLKITYIEQGDPRGLAHVVLCAKEFLGDSPFVMYLGDNLIRDGITKLVQEFEENNADALILLSHVENPSRFGVAEIENDKVLRVVEKPKKPKTDLAIAGVYLFRQSIFDAISMIKPSWRNELEITDAIQQLIVLGKNVRPHVVEGWWKDTGRPRDLLEANQLVLSNISTKIKGKVSKDSVIQGNVRIGKNSEILSGCHLRGPLVIGENCKLGPDTYIGPYTSIGNNCSIEGCDIEYSIIMEGSHISRIGRVVDSLIGRDTKISSKSELRPKGNRLIVGDKAQLHI
jgi:glucose-1-phosphate thymidylyltransferase